MKIAQFFHGEAIRLGLVEGDRLVPLAFQGTMIDFIRGGGKAERLSSPPLPLEQVRFAPAVSDPSKIIACCEKPILRPIKDYELIGQTPSVVFSAGAVEEDNGDVKIYYGGADTVQCLAYSSIDDLIDMCYNRV